MTTKNTDSNIVQDRMPPIVVTTPVLDNQKGKDE